nr:Hint domain-containing protein [Donghicola mangrovi]
MESRETNVVHVGATKRRFGAGGPLPELPVYGDEPSFASPFSVPCFTPGTRIATRQGPIAVEDLRTGDLLLTRDNGFCPVLWVGRSHYRLAQSMGGARLQPVMIKAGAFGEGVPQTDLLISPDHQMLLTRRLMPRALPCNELLVPARHLLSQAGVVVAPQREVEFVHVLMERHEILLADGAWTESYRPDSSVVRSLPNDVRVDLLASLGGRDPMRGPVFEAARQSAGPEALSPEADR